MELAKVVLKKEDGRTLRAGGAWIFDNEIDSIEGEFTNGGLVRVFAFNDFCLGTGFINTNSKIRIRMLSRSGDAVVDDAFIRSRVRDAVEYRKHVIDMSSCRLIFGEADFLPGLVVDKFADILVVESLALGIDRYKLLIIDELKELLAAEGMPIRGVYERSDAAVRLKEGLPLEKGFIGEPFDTNVLITENGVQFSVDVAEGQKTGYFLDQKMNRAAIRPLCKGARVLDLFTHTGSFALNAAASGASSVLAVDSSEPALAQARINAGLNGFSETISFRCADIFELLPELERQGERYDVIILDPPAFAKSRESLKNARKGYKEINLRAMRLLNDGGYLATCSCSHFMTPELFYETVLSASKDAHKRIRQIEYRTQAADHPILWPAMESYYLKFYILQVSNQK
ncbi:MAG: class I SAM-dependent rRNA methyltransferase [Clostridiaceae bacterium]|nr:class I SAM-dependent rRNA methyltransferase [Clostridiaceae bacterium]